MLRTVRTLEAQNGVEPIVIDVRDTTSASVRPVPSAAKGGSDNVINIPLEHIRSRIDFIKGLASRGKPIVTCCNLGKLSYFATRILAGHSIEASSLSGGVSTLRTKPVTLLTEPISHAPINKSMQQKKTETATAVVDVSTVETLDLCGLSCPGPIMAIRKKIPSLAPGQRLCVKASDPGFYNDFPAFCRVGGLEVVSCLKENGIITGVLQKPFGDSIQTDSPAVNSSNPINKSKDLALVVFSGEMDKVMAAFVLANGAIAMGGKVTMFFTFWGLNALRVEHAKINTPKTGDDMLSHTTHSILDRMMGMMMPKGPDQLPLTHMQMGGMGPMAMKLQMKQKNLPNLPDLMRDARAGNARIVACTMSMSAFGLESEDLLDGIEYGGVADFLEAAGDAKSTLFI